MIALLRTKNRICIIEKSNNSIATKLCNNLLNKRRYFEIFLVYNTIKLKNCLVRYLNAKIK